MSGREKVRTGGIDHPHLNVYDIGKAIALLTGLFECKHNIPLYIDSIDGMNSNEGHPPTPLSADLVSGD